MIAHRFSRDKKGKGIASSSKWIREEPIKLPEIDTSALVEANKLTLIGRVINPDLTKSKAVVAFLPTLWPISGCVSDKDLGRDKFQFTFSSKRDLEIVLKKAPFHYKHWMIVLQRWEPVISDFFPIHYLLFGSESKGFQYTTGRMKSSRQSVRS